MDIKTITMLQDLRIRTNADNKAVAFIRIHIHDGILAVYVKHPVGKGHDKALDIGNNVLYFELQGE